MGYLIAARLLFATKKKTVTSTKLHGPIIRHYTARRSTQISRTLKVSTQVPFSRLKVFRSVYLMETALRNEYLSFSDVTLQVLGEVFS